MGSSCAAFIERDEFFILRRRGFVFALKVKFFGDFELKTFYLAHFGKGVHGDLLEVRQRGGGQSCCHRKPQNHWNNKLHFLSFSLRACSHLLYSELA